MWRLQEVSPAAKDHGSGALKARFELSGGPGSPSTLAAQFSCEGSTLSGAEFQLLGSGYRVSLVKRRFVSGESFLAVCQQGMSDFRWQRG